MAKVNRQRLTQAQYATHRGCSAVAVHKAIKQGRITTFDDGTIDPEVADIQWAKNSRARVRTTPAPTPAPTAAPAPGDLVDQAAGAPGPAIEAGAAPVPSSLAGDPSYQDARARQAQADARTAELKLAELEGQLVRVDQVHAAFASKLAPVREALLQFPARLAPLLASQSDSGRIQTMLEVEIHQVLAPLSTVSAAVASEGTGG
jgi:hypothetical protein